MNATAEAAMAAGRFEEARDEWQRMLALLPDASRQHAAITGRADEATRRMTEAGRPLIAPTEGGIGKRGAAVIVAIAVFALTKLKFLALGLTKLSTFVSMFAFFGVYWSMFGWPLAAGLVVSIYIHEMGHVAELRRLGIAAGAPLFIPGVGALVLLKQRIMDPAKDAIVGLAGPVWGFGASLVAFLVYQVTSEPIFSAIAQLNAFINLFNLIPIWQLDGSRGFHALTRWQRWMVVAALGIALVLSGQRMLVIIGAVAAWRALQKSVAVAPDMRALATFIGLIVGLTWLSTLPAVVR